MPNRPSAAPTRFFVPRGCLSLELRRYVPDRARGSGGQGGVDVSEKFRLRNQADSTSALTDSCTRRTGVPVGEVIPRAERDLARLYATHGRGLLSHCARILGDFASAEDATQEVFLRVRRCAGKRPDASEMRPWLFRIATNHCLNELRRRGVRARTPPQIIGTTTADLEDSMAARNDARRLLERLPPRVRAIAWLTYVDGMLQQEVAEALGVSRRTVVNCLGQVRSRLAQGSRGGLST